MIIVPSTPEQREKRIGRKVTCIPAFYESFAPLDLSSTYTIEIEKDGQFVQLCGVPAVLFEGTWFFKLMGATMIKTRPPSAIEFTAPE